MDDDTLQAALTEYFAPWVQALALKVEASRSDSVVLRLPQSDQLSRVGGRCAAAGVAALHKQSRTPPWAELRS